MFLAKMTQKYHTDGISALNSQIVGITSEYPSHLAVSNGKDVKGIRKLHIGSMTVTRVRPITFGYV